MTDFKRAADELAAECIASLKAAVAVLIQDHAPATQRDQAAARADSALAALSAQTRPLSAPVGDRPTRDVAEIVVGAYLQRKLGREPAFALEEDGDDGWAFWITEDGAEGDTTSYLRTDLRVEWLGTSWEPSAPVGVVCPNCGSSELTWDVSYKDKSGVADGRLRVHDVGCLFVLGCDECSETVKVTRAEDVAANLAGVQPAAVDEAIYRKSEVREAMEVLRGRNGSTALHPDVLDEMERVLTAALWMEVDRVICGAAVGVLGPGWWRNG